MRIRKGLDCISVTPTQLCHPHGLEWYVLNFPTIFGRTKAVLTEIVCAINTNDEEKCITIARHLMRDGGISDSSRMFALLSKLCQSPVSWYTSGPAQKFILRQIKAIDVSYEATAKSVAGKPDFDQNITAAAKLSMDICLLMLYGHILFTSTSYTYAIGKHLRAKANCRQRGSK